MLVKIIFIFVLVTCVVRVDAGDEGDSCIKDDVAGMCTDLSKCPAAIRDIKNRKLPQICSFNNTTPIVCCVDNTASTTVPPQNTVESAITTEYAPAYIDEDYGNDGSCQPLLSQLTASKNGRKAWDKCIDYQQLVFPCENTAVLTTHRVNKCSHGADELIIESSRARPHEFPYSAFLGYGNDSQLEWLCDGALISDLFLITAAHCANSREYGLITYAALGVTNKLDITPHNRYRVKRIISHPEYKPPKKYHDIALLELEMPIRLDSFSVPACLDAGESERRTAFSTSTHNGSSHDTTELYKLHLSKFPTAECAKLYPGYRRIQPFNETSQLCYGDRTQSPDFSQDYGGSPLVVNNRNLYCMYTIIGVSSYGMGCISCPGVYTRVTQYVPWIEGVVWP